jgi:asparagine synthase (glutamine-hydrolysing)
MCGIAGIFGNNDTPTLKKMLLMIAHRGPDDEYLVASENFCLGARRLSIIDLERGRQPMSNETKDIWVAQNGEIYNYRALRLALANRGHRFATRCDTEALVHLYEEEGPSFPVRLNGMFAVAIWDDARKRGVLARDRMGKKPLYYVEQGPALAFASEIKGLLQLPGFDRRINYEALHHYLSYKHVPCPLSIFEGIKLLPPGHVLTFSREGTVRVKRYWSPEFSHSFTGPEVDEDYIVSRIIDLLRKGMERRLRSDVPVGFFLSGGIDSGLATALAAEVSTSQIKTFTLTYAKDRSTAGKELDRRCARRISQMYGTDHHEEQIDFGNFPEQLPRIIRHFDEPFGGVVSTYFLSKSIRKHVKVALSGDAADELFGSYLSHRLAFPLEECKRARNEGSLTWKQLVPFENRPGFLEKHAEKPDWAWRYELLVFGDDEKLRLYSPSVVDRMRGYSTKDHLKGYFDDLTAKDPLNRILEAELGSFLPDQVLTFVDRLSMAHSLEVRTAYLDPEFVDFVCSVPGHLKINNGVTKYILKKAALKYLPEEIVFRSKEGFLMPITQWIHKDLQEYVRSTLSPTNLSKHDIFDIGAVGRLIDDLYERPTDYSRVNKVLLLVIFQVWYDIYMN